MQWAGLFVQGRLRCWGCRSGTPVLAFCRGAALVVVQQKGLNQAAHLLSCAAQIHTLLILPAQQQAGVFRSCQLPMHNCNVWLSTKHTFPCSLSCRNPQGDVHELQRKPSRQVCKDQQQLCTTYSKSRPAQRVVAASGHALLE